MSEHHISSPLVATKTTRHPAASESAWKTRSRHEDAADGQSGGVGRRALLFVAFIFVATRKRQNLVRAQNVLGNVLLAADVFCVVLRLHQILSRGEQRATVSKSAGQRFQHRHWRSSWAPQRSPRRLMATQNESTPSPRPSSKARPGRVCEDASKGRLVFMSCYVCRLYPKTPLWYVIKMSSGKAETGLCDGHTLTGQV